MSEKKKIFKPLPISGFPEWLPETRAVELQWFDHIRRIFESYGFCNIETPSVELLDALKAKGGDGEADVDKEIYVLDRYHKEEGDKEARLALHFDQTVPLARYTAQHFNELVFPFKRYQMQRVWRGERPQAGRFREFYQCDIDVINVDSLPLHFDAEMPAIIWEILSSLPGMEKEKDNIQIRISNRKILWGYLEATGITNSELITVILRNLDKVEKIGIDAVMHNVTEFCEKNSIETTHETLNEPILYFYNRFAVNKYSECELLHEASQSLIKKYSALYGNETFRAGMRELIFVLSQLSHLPKNSVVADPSIIRGLDYYTGTVYETVFLDDPGYGSICSGGRYDDLAGNYINKHLPGVGISIGFSRLFDRLRQQNKLPTCGVSPADILVVMPKATGEEQEAEDVFALESVMQARIRALTMETAQKLRAQGHKVETFHNPVKLARQLAYAEKKGIPYVWFPPFEDGKDHEVKNMQAGTQTKADPDKWEKDE